jgi:3',5'-nucleoside bisphosphate phosphatase
LVDLHLHTTASDGRFAPEELVTRVAAAGITVMSVTDHDTIAGLADARGAAEAAGIEFVDGVEVTAVAAGRDVHMLGYFIDPADQAFNEFLAAQRGRRVERVREIGARLRALGIGIDIDRLLARAARKPGASVGRPALARALVRANHVDSVQEAFDRFLAAGRPGFVPRVGVAPHVAVEIIHAAGGLASMAHPGVTNNPAVMAALASQSLDAIEVFHSDHPPEVRRQLQEFAAEHRLLMTGGSDFHGDRSRDRPLGRSVLPRDAFDRLTALRDTREAAR